MPLASTLLKSDFLVADPAMTGAELLAALQGKNLSTTYLLLPGSDGRYIVTFWDTLRRLAERSGQDIMTVVIGTLAAQLKPSEAVDRNSVTEESARKRRRQQPNERLVVLEHSAVIGVYANERRGAEQLPLGAEVEATLTDKSVQGISADNRVINAWIADKPESEPLQVGQSYELIFDVNAPRQGATTAAVDWSKVFVDPKMQQVEVLVVIASEDFELIGEYQQTLIVPRSGPSKNKVRFTINPQRNGPGKITAMFFANGRAFQKMIITLQVGPVMQIATSGVTLMAAATRPPRPNEQIVSITILRRDAGYQFLVKGAVVQRFVLNLSEAAVEQLVGLARAELLAIVKTPSPTGGGLPVYQRTDTTIPPEIHRATLQRLARLGALLYDKLFYGTSGGDQLGDLLRDLSARSRLRIEVVPERFVFPWGLLYATYPLDLNAINPEDIWGFKHIIEYTPEFTSATPINIDPTINVVDKLGIAFVVNTTIDAELARKTTPLPPVIGPQREYLLKIAGTSVVEYPNVQDLYDLLNNPNTPTQLIYFYCHAVSRLPGEPGGVGSSLFRLSDGPVTLDDLSLNASRRAGVLKQAPLVFVNACESAELSPLLYDGLVPYLISKGARGVIGTEVETPVYFSEEFARKFLPAFVSGAKPLGELLLDLRREYLFEKNNVMGLLYALYSSGDVQVQRDG